MRLTACEPSTQPAAAPFTLAPGPLPVLSEHHALCRLVRQGHSGKAREMGDFCFSTYVLLETSRAATEVVNVKV